jgi:nucleotide-binding universal stress UspA family protein
MKANQKASTEMLEKTHRQMAQSGVAADRIEICSRIRTTGVAEDLLDECRLKSYDAIALGRRGITYLQEMVTGSVTANLLEHSQVTPVWMVDSEVPNSRIVLAADGSQNALRALDHLAFILGGQADAKIHVIHVKPQLRDICEIDVGSETMAAAEEIILDSDRHCIDGFYKQALGVLQKNKLDPSQFDIQTVESRFSIAGAILDTARHGGFGTIVIGRRGFKKSMFTGSVSRKIIQKVNKMAVWLVP